MNMLNQLKSITSIGKKVAGSEETVVLAKPRTKFDKFMNTFNRLPRPALLIGIVLMIIHAFNDPEHYTLWMKALQNTPAELWYIITIVIVSWAGTKFVRDVKMPSDEKVIQVNTGTVLNTADKIQGTERTFDNLQDVDDDILELPPENVAIEDWKKLNEQGEPSR